MNSDQRVRVVLLFYFHYFLAFCLTCIYAEQPLPINENKMFASRITIYVEKPFLPHVCARKPLLAETV